MENLRAKILGAWTPFLREGELSHLFLKIFQQCPDKTARLTVPNTMNWNCVHSCVNLNLFRGWKMEGLNFWNVTCKSVHFSVFWRHLSRPIVSGYSFGGVTRYCHPSIFFGGGITPHPEINATSPRKWAPMHGRTSLFDFWANVKLNWPGKENSKVLAGFLVVISQDATVSACLHETFSN